MDEQLQSFDLIQVEQLDSIFLHLELLQ